MVSPEEATDDYAAASYFALLDQTVLLNHVQDAIWMTDLDGEILFWNDSAEALYGWSRDHVFDKRAGALLFREDDPRFAEAMAAMHTKGVWNGEMRQLCEAGRLLIVESTWKLIPATPAIPPTILVVNTDVTEKREMEAHVLRSQRMESLGTLAGGIAHDMNNILGPILMSVQLLRMRIEDPSGTKLLDTLEVSAQRGADLMRQILSFARGADGERIVMDLTPLLSEMQKVQHDTFPRGIEIAYDLEDDLWPVEGDATQLHQIFMNLCVNARDAMPDGGRLMVKVSNRDVSPRFIGSFTEFPDARPGRFVLISVIDTGMGMPPEVRDRIFEPFFTTKETGTGLGLATSIGIIKSHGGFIDVSSEPGRGTRFDVYLPASEAAPDHVVDDEEAVTLRGNGELILVVDDEEAFRLVLQETLENCGFRVLVAENGAEGVAQYARHAGEVVAVITDIMMPVMDGYMLIKAVRSINPDARILAASGLISNEKVDQMAGLKVDGFLTKPYKTEELMGTLGRILVGSPAAS